MAALRTVVRRFGDFADAEDAPQQDIPEAATSWPARGMPESPAGWLIYVGSRRMTDRLRSEAARRRREDLAAAGHHRLHAVCGHLLERAERLEEARAEYETAARRTTSVPEQHYLSTQAARFNDRRA
jgi:predicted RNA polymerase sigma factor